MGRFRVSVACLMTVTAVVGVGIVALLNASEGWADASRVTVFLVLFGSILGVIYRERARRAFWIGVLTFGWGYLLFAHVGPLKGSPLDLSNRVERLLVLARLQRTYPAPVEGGTVWFWNDEFTPTGPEHTLVGATVLRPLGPNIWYVHIPGVGDTSRDQRLFEKDNNLFYLAVGDRLANLLCSLMGGALALAFHRGRTTTAGSRVSPEGVEAVPS